mmetsp:Transcript_7256/g.30873  ORF Transcript_7256/g.30873 Transcript_7256/m.30873 type:complete len:289 (+) Transcript_7256:37-903(+)|eukprot:CAMPEP_0114633684 /NCGR_PEP_ID=MMETSP0168-20121206/15579_1 /TAXON_ID=95228 ORGANISM="Vannella sp., Strain DIVA3 517/6/12" /NCGR_SAMPLE_ID=MMETSP0168 /ASSEMBLY_ACC=CAM_ASM_000044 /LENGTH=288 /DNA_ID=CAMNT_0001845337 /DNA_START=17 /DNA_END=883 /DNA_ORIENTATION=+
MLGRVLLAACLLTAVVLAFEHTLHEDFLPTPGGRAIHKDCVHHIPHGASLHVEEDKSGYRLHHHDGSIERHEPCPHAPHAMHGQAWKAWAQYLNEDSFDFMSAEWPVPSEPTTEKNQILYFWPGTEPGDNSFVIQPVLQWGNTPAGGGNYWAMASWYVGDRAYFSPLIDCNVGDMVYGEMNESGSGQWAIISEDSTTGEKISLNVTTSVPQDYAYIVLESYYLFDCTEYPADESSELFTNIVTKVNGTTVTPTWETYNDNPGSFTACDEEAVVDSDTSVEIDFRNTKR